MAAKKKAAKKKAAQEPEPAPAEVDHAEIFLVAQMAATIYSTMHQRTQALDEEGRMQYAVQEAVGILHWASEGLAKLQADADA